VLSRILTVAAVLVCLAGAAHAQAPLQLQIANGRVTLHAQNVPVRAILEEWSKLGGAKIINGERVAGAPLTLDLEGVPERQALQILLRGVSGYVLAARQSGQPGVSMYDRIMILPTSVAPRNPPPAPVVAGGIRPIAPRAPDDPNSADDQDAAQGNDGVPLGQPVPLPRPVPVGPRPGAIVPPPVVASDNEPDQQQPPVAPTPANPFGLPPGSSQRPGVITPPQPQPPQQQPPQQQAPR
jgi:hypothetical protein